MTSRLSKVSRLIPTTAAPVARCKTPALSLGNVQPFGDYAVLTQGLLYMRRALVTPL